MSEFMLGNDQSVKPRRMSECDAQFLQSQNYYCLAAEKWYENEKALVFIADNGPDGKPDPFICLPDQRDLWEREQNKYWMFMAGGANIYLRFPDEDKIYSVNGLRSSWMKTDPNTLSIFCGFPGWSKYGEFAEHFFQTSVAGREIIEECIMLLPTGYPMIPDAILSHHRLGLDYVMEILENRKVMIQTCIPDFEMMAAPALMKSQMIPLKGSKPVDLVFGSKVYGSNLFNHRRHKTNALPVFSQKSRNVNLVEAIVIDYNGDHQDIQFFDGEEGLTPDVLLDRKIFLCECEENFKLKRQANGDVVVAAVYQTGQLLPREQWFAPKPGYLLEAIDQALY